MKRKRVYDWEREDFWVALFVLGGSAIVFLLEIAMIVAVIWGVVKLVTYFA